MATKTTVSEDRVAAARLAKALRVVAVLREAGCTDVETLDAFDAVGRARAEQAANVRHCSDATWRMIRDLLGRVCPHGLLKPTADSGCPEWHAPSARSGRRARTA